VVDNQTTITTTFAPYLDVTAWPTFNMTQWTRLTGVKAYTLSFVVADSLGRPSWGGYYPILDSKAFYMSEIIALRKLGGDVIVSFGGATGKMA
jgi:chitinase